MRLRSSEANDIIRHINYEESSLKEKTCGLTKKDFKLYKMLYKGIRKESRLSLVINFALIVRRLIMLYVAMFLAQYAWLQIMLFVSLSLISQLHLVHTWPFKEKTENWLSIFNE